MAGTVAVIRVGEFTMNVADYRLKVTAVAFVNRLPGDDDARSDGAAGRAERRDRRDDQEVHRARRRAAGCRDATGPVVAAAGTVALICVSELMMNAADTHRRT